MITIPHTSVQTDITTSKNELRYKNMPFLHVFQFF
jgi:hypothetical protein